MKCADSLQTLLLSSGGSASRLFFLKGKTYLERNTHEDEKNAHRQTSHRAARRTPVLAACIIERWEQAGDFGTIVFRSSESAS